MEDLVKELTIDMVPDGDNRIIAETIGVENYYKLCSVVGGSTIYLQKPESVLRPVRDAHIKAEFNGYNRARPQVRRDGAVGAAALRRGEAGGTDEPSRLRRRAGKHYVLRQHF